MGRNNKPRTLVAVHEAILYDNIPTIYRVVLLRLAPHISKVGQRLWGGRAISRTTARYPKDMTRDELLGQKDLLRGGIRIGFAMSKEDFGGGDEQDVVLGLSALGRQGTLEEGGKKGIERWHPSYIRASRRPPVGGSPSAKRVTGRVGAAVVDWN